LNFLFVAYKIYPSEEGETMKTNLQECRKNAGFKSAKAFADHIGMSVNTYTNYEQGRRPMTLEQAWEFADELDCTLDELAGREWSAQSEAPPDPVRDELNALYSSCTPQRRQRLVEYARDAALASKSTAERGERVAELSEAV
jgi:transcriptional regulator with XRE-family HTH domain